MFMAQDSSLCFLYSDSSFLYFTVYGSRQKSMFSVQKIFVPVFHCLAPTESLSLKYPQYSNVSLYLVSQSNAKNTSHMTLVMKQVQQKFV